MTWGIAVYAALVATAALIWQVVSYRHSHRTSVTVDHSVQLLSFGGQARGAVVVTVRNRSEFTIRVTRYALRIRGNTWVYSAPPYPSGTELPGRISPHDSAIGLFEVADIYAEGPVVARVELSSDKPFYSKAKPLTWGKPDWTPPEPWVILKLKRRVRSQAQTFVAYVARRSG